MAILTDPQLKKVEEELRRLDQQVDAMDGKIRAYLADRQRKPHPRHHELVEKIQQYRIPAEAASKQLETSLDNLQWKVFYHFKAWQQLWENAEAAYRQGRPFGRMEKPSMDSSESAYPEGSDKSSQSMHSFWQLQQKKAGEMGASARESEDEFKKRIKARYQQLTSNKGDDQEIVMTFNKEKKRCTLELKRKG